MKLYFIGHDYKYAAEQMLLTLFPDRRPEYPETPAQQGEEALTLSLSVGAVWATATARLVWNGQVYCARRRCRSAQLTGGLETDRACQRILKLAFYEVGTRALNVQPPWGALTGVRPVKIPTKAMLSGKTAKQARAILEEEYFVSPDRAELAMSGGSIAGNSATGTEGGAINIGGPNARISFSGSGLTRPILRTEASGAASRTY